MSIDPKYVEEVTNEKIDYESVLEEFGIKAGAKSNDNGIDTTGYTVTTLKEMFDGETYTGRPVLSDIYTVEFRNKTTGETRINHKIDLVLFDETYEDEKEALIFPINLNSDNIDFDKNIVENVSTASGLYALAMGLMELKAKGISKAYGDLEVVGIKLLQKQLAKYENLTVDVVEKKFVNKDKEETYYNSFKITEGEEY